MKDEILDSPLKESLIYEYLTQMSIGLYFLHNAKLIHNDIKPENILKMRPGKSTIKIADLGVTSKF